MATPEPSSAPAAPAPAVGELREPHGLVTSFDLVTFRNREQEPRSMLELLGFTQLTLIEVTWTRSSGRVRAMGAWRRPSR